MGRGTGLSLAAPESLAMQASKRSLLPVLCSCRKLGQRFNHQGDLVYEEITDLMFLSHIMRGGKRRNLEVSFHCHLFFVHSELCPRLSHTSL